MNELKVFHYTTRLNLSQILRDKTINMSQGFTEMEKSGVWLSTNPDFENSAASIARVNNNFRLRKESEIKTLGMARIEINTFDVKIFSINQYKNISRISTRNFKNLCYFAAQCKADINEWRISFSPIKLKSWKKIEIYDNLTRQWKEYKYPKKDFNELKNILIKTKEYIEFMDNKQKEKLVLFLNEIKNQIKV
jgi:hypothetical protein